MELLEFQNNLNRKWQKKIHHSCWVAFFIILFVQLIVFFSYIKFGEIQPNEILLYLSVRVFLPSGVNLVSLLVTRWALISPRFSVEHKNYAVCINILVVCTVISAAHNFYFIIWMAPSVALFYSTLFHSNRILTATYVGTIFSAFVSMTVNIIEGDFETMASMSYCIITVGLFTCSYYVSRMIIRHHQLQLDYTYQELEKKQQLIERLDIEPMTRLYNRKAFERNMQETLNNSEKIIGYKDKTVWLLVFDLDYFKSINDTYGHINGDKVLLAVASVLERGIGKDGRVYRYGGEEFTALTHLCSEEKIVEIAEKIRKEIELLRFEFDVEKRITISIGISPHCKNIDAKRWMEKADDALYYSKRNGRNQIKIYL